MAIESSRYIEITSHGNDNEAQPVNTGTVIIEEAEKEYTAFEVFAHNYDIPIGENSDLGGYVSEAITANMTHVMILRTTAMENVADCDAVVDWGDGTTSVIADGDYNTAGFMYDDAGAYTVQHTYATPGKYIVKVYGKTVYNIQHREDLTDDNGNTSENYNLMCRVLTADLPVSLYLMANLSSFCRSAKRLLAVDAETIKYKALVNVGGIFRGCSNLLTASNFDREFQRANCEAAFRDCINMVNCDMVLPLCSLYQTACDQMYMNCSKLAENAGHFLTYYSINCNSMYFRKVFYNCSSLTGSALSLADILWNNSNIKWKSAEDAFTGSGIYAAAPQSWGGAAYDSIICPTGVVSYGTVSAITFENNKYYKVSGTVSSIKIRISENNKNAMCKFTTASSVSVSSINVDPSLVINKPFDFQPNTTYLIAVDLGVILWTALENS